MTDARPKTDPVDKVKADILAGRYDGDLADLTLAIHERALSQATALRWSMEWDGQTLREDDCTLGVAAMVESFTGLDWAAFDPRLSAGNCRALLVAWLHHRDGISVPDAQALVDNANVRELGDTFKVYEVPQGPFETGPG